MGWASYQEDNIDARGESKSFTRIPRSSRSIPRLSQPVKSQFKVGYLRSPNDPFKSTPVPTTPDITQQPKPSPKTRQRIRRREPLKKQDAPVVKTRHVTSDEIQQRIHQANFIKTQRVTTDDLQQRIQREIIRQQKEI